MALAVTIHAADPSASVVSGGIVSKPLNPDVQDGAPFLGDVFGLKSARSAVDIVAVHPYAKNARATRKAVEETRKTLDRAGMKRTPIWVTEIGWGSDPSSGADLAKTPQEQADLLSESFGALRDSRDELGVGGGEAVRAVAVLGDEEPFGDDDLEEVLGHVRSLGELRERQELATGLVGDRRGERGVGGVELPELHLDLRREVVDHRVLVGIPGGDAGGEVGSAGKVGLPDVEQDQHGLLRQEPEAANGLGLVVRQAGVTDRGARFERGLEPPEDDLLAFVRFALGGRPMATA